MRISYFFITKTLIFSGILLLTSFSVNAETFHLVLNGKSHHTNDKQYNETNTGLGFEMEFNEQEKNIKFLAASSFKDSFDNTSNYFGGGIKRRFRWDNDKDGWYGDIAVIGFVMTRKDYNNNSPFFRVLPFVSVGKGRFAVNLAYIPELSPKTTSLFYLQAKIRMFEW